MDDHDLVMRTLHGYFDHYDLDSIDAVVLGCTHFVFFRDYFRELLPDSAAIIDGNEGTVRHLHVVLESLGKLAPEDAAGGVELSNSDPSPASPPWLGPPASSITIPIRPYPSLTRRPPRRPHPTRPPRFGL